MKNRRGNTGLYLLIIGAGALLGLLFLNLNKNKTPKIKKLASGDWQYGATSPSPQFQVYFRQEAEEPQIKFASKNSSLLLTPQIGDKEFSFNEENSREIKIKDAQNEVDIVYKITSQGLKEEIIVNTPEAINNRFLYALNFDNLMVKKRLEGLWYFYQKDDLEFKNPVFHIPKASMTDAQGKTSDKIQINYLIENSQEYFEVKADKNWLSDSSRAYPVIIDPSLEIPPQNNEIASLRTENSKTYANPEGGLTAIIRAGDIHHLDNSGDLQEIDTTFKKSNDPNFTFEVTANKMKVYFKKDLSEDYFLKTQINDSVVRQAINNNQPGLGALNTQSAAIAQNNTLTYPEIFSGVDLRYTLTESRLLEEYIVKNPQSAKNISKLIQQIEISGVSLKKEDDGSINFFAQEQTDPLFSFPIPLMYEENFADPQILKYQIESLNSQSQKYQVTKALDSANLIWLASSARTYPLYIDTTLNLQTGASADDGRCYDVSGDGFDSGLVVAVFGKLPGGTSYGTWNRFPNVTIPQGSTISSATLEWESGGTYSTTANITFYANDADNPAAPTNSTDFRGRALTSASVNWNISASWSFQSRYAAPDLSSIVQEIINRGTWSSGYAILLMSKDNGTTAGNLRSFRTYDVSVSDGPSLSIVYTAPTPTLPPYATDTPAPPGPFKFEGLKMEGVKVE
ncbi:MAG: hypothetical protein ABIB61_00680 [Candidatus Shapirobacteria bacterium]